MAAPSDPRRASISAGGPVGAPSQPRRAPIPAGGPVRGHPARRVVLAAAAALPLAAVSGCAGPDVLAAPPGPAPDVRMLRSAIAAEQLMVDHYAAVLDGARTTARTSAGAAAASTSADGDSADGDSADGGRWPTALIAVLEPVLAEHRAHLAQLHSRLIVPAGSRAAEPAASGRSAAGTAVPSAPEAAVAFLRAAEQAAATALLDWLPHVPGSLAQLFASISASEATHVPVLDAAASVAGQAS